MESLVGSDTESECFESAEESLDESNELEFETINSKKSSYSKEREVAEPIFCNNSSTPESNDQLEKNISNLSYRKRPERLKRSISKPLRRSTSNSSSNEVIINADKIVPDEFFQDITSSLTKNINKSLNTLQQTSSNVKDLILNSLPVSSLSDNEGFSYDDKESSYSLTESNSQSNDHSEICPSVSEQIVENEEKDIERKSECSHLTTNTTVTGSANKHETIIESANTGSDDVKTKNLNFKEDEAHDIVQLKIDTSNEVEEKQFDSNSSMSDCSSTVTGETTQQNTKSTYEEDDLHDSDKTCSSYTISKTLDDQNKTDNEEINSAVSLNKDQQNEESDCTKQKVTKTMDLLDKEPDVQEKDLKSAVLDELNHENNFSYLEISDDNKYLTNEEADKCLSENENKDHSDCNVEELKMALKNIFKEENNNSDITKENIDNKILNEDCNLEEKMETNLNSNDGWDDFDFSDDEVENINQSDKNVNIKKDGENLNNVPLEKNKVGIAKSDSPNVEIKNQKSKKLVSSPDSLIKSSICEKKNSAEAVKNEDLNEKKQKSAIEDQKKIEKTKKDLESKSEYDESWGWDDWDEIPDNEDKNKFKPSENPSEKKPVEENFFDVSKWSGWDTFGQKPQEKQGNWNLGSWGVDVLLNKATAVTQGISNVIEAGLGAPDPETLIRLEKEERVKVKEYEKEKSEVEEEPSVENSKKNSLTNVSLFPVSGITNLVAGVTSKIVEHSKIQEIGSKVITGGLDTLESFGKKTMEVLQEGDPGLKNKRALLLGNNKPVLSQVLKEAREKAEKEMKKAEEKEITKKCHFETLFDDFKGMVHLEALEMLSRQGELKLDQIKNGMNSDELEDLNGILEEVEQLCCLEEWTIELKSSVVDFKTAMQMAVEPLKNEISIQRMIEIHEDVHKWLKMGKETKPSIMLINQKLVSTLAELTAATVQQFHKSGELLCVKECRKTVEEVDALSRLTNVVCKEIGSLGEKFLLLSRTTSSLESNDKNVESFHEKVTVVVNNSVLYIRQAFNLLIPVIQLGAAV